MQESVSALPAGYRLRLTGKVCFDPHSLAWCKLHLSSSHHTDLLRRTNLLLTKLLLMSHPLLRRWWNQELDSRIPKLFHQSLLIAFPAFRVSKKSRVNAKIECKRQVDLCCKCYKGIYLFCFFPYRILKLICFSSRPDPEHTMETASVAIQLTDTTNSCYPADRQTDKFRLPKVRARISSLVVSTSFDFFWFHCIGTYTDNAARMWMHQQLLALTEPEEDCQPPSIYRTAPSYVSVNPESVLEVAEPNK